eukprot:sb/3461582/
MACGEESCGFRPCGLQNAIDPRVSCPNLDFSACSAAVGPKVSSNTVYDDRCDGNCDHYSCEDESECDGVVYGIRCTKYGQPNKYIQPSFLCDSYPNCDAGEDEDRDMCTNTTYLHCTRSVQEFRRANMPVINRCSAPFSDGIYKPLCLNSMDQTNCSGSEAAGLTCKIDGYWSTVSKTVLCILPHSPLCDNGMDQECTWLSTSCFLHKHLICDGISHCEDGSDEQCPLLTNSTCQRFTMSPLPIPIPWLLDGVTDCISGLDELQGVWPVCGVGGRKRFVVDNSTCSEVYYCPGRAAFLELSQLCDGVEECGEEVGVCKESLNQVKVFSQPVKSNGDSIYLSHCLPGLKGILTSDCVALAVPKREGLLEKGIVNTLHITPTNCNFLYGEAYVRVSCSNMCLDPTTPCPITRRLEYDSCTQQYPDRTYTLADNSYLTFLLPGDEVFRCANNRCVALSAVCNLADECGDGSDERECRNNFQCRDTSKYIPLSQVCDGAPDCVDLSDECNEQCSVEVLFSLPYLVVCCVLGFLATTLNIGVLVSLVVTLYKEGAKKKVQLYNRLLILLISCGDLLTGCYLSSIAITHLIYTDTYCTHRYTWLTSRYCATLGVVSTIGTQISVHAMAILGVTRLVAVKNSLRDWRNCETVKKTALVKIGLVLLGVVVVCVSFAIVPLIPSLRDVFVNGMVYPPYLRLFAGTVDKMTHWRVFRAYYGYLSSITLSWKQVESLVSEMFSRDYQDVSQSMVHFYGNSEVCLFKFFVSRSDPQRYYTWVLIGADCICFLTTTVCYMIINCRTQLATRTLAQNMNAVRDRNRKLQNKVLVIVLTNQVVWLPFVLLCSLHTAGVVNGGRWYVFISICILPLNSVINPCLYNTELFEKVMGKMLSWYTVPDFQLLGRIKVWTSSRKDIIGAADIELGPITVGTGLVAQVVPTCSGVDLDIQDESLAPVVACQEEILAPITPRKRAGSLPVTRVELMTIEPSTNGLILRKGTTVEQCQLSDEETVGRRRHSVN